MYVQKLVGNCFVKQWNRTLLIPHTFRLVCQSLLDYHSIDFDTLGTCLGIVSKLSCHGIAVQVYKFI